MRRPSTKNIVKELVKDISFEKETLDKKQDYKEFSSGPECI